MDPAAFCRKCGHKGRQHQRPTGPEDHFGNTAVACVSLDRAGLPCRCDGRDEPEPVPTSVAVGRPSWQKVERAKEEAPRCTYQVGCRGKVVAHVTDHMVPGREFLTCARHKKKIAGLSGYEIS